MKTIKFKREFYGTHAIMQLENIKSQFLRVSSKCKVTNVGNGMYVLHYAINILTTYPTASAMDSLCYKMQLCY